MIKYIAELIGTFFFIFIILNSIKKNNNLNNIPVPISIGIGLIASIILVGPFSGAHLNPAFTLVSFLNNSITLNDLIFYIIFQYIGALMAKISFDKFHSF